MGTRAAPQFAAAATVSEAFRAAYAAELEKQFAARRATQTPSPLAPPASAGAIGA
ncbi:MAG: hypothetical protein ACREC0_13885 [Methylocella sp.]